MFQDESNSFFYIFISWEEKEKHWRRCRLNIQSKETKTVVSWKKPAMYVSFDLFHIVKEIIRNAEEPSGYFYSLGII
jgi:hypothetical protein